MTTEDTRTCWFPISAPILAQLQLDADFIYGYSRAMKLPDTPARPQGHWPAFVFTDEVTISTAVFLSEYVGRRHRALESRAWSCDVASADARG